MNEIFEIKKLDYYISKNVYSMRQTPPRTVEHYEFELYTTSGNISIINDRKYNQNIGNILIAKPGDIRYTIDAFECYCVHFLCRDSEIQKSLNTLPNVFHSYGTERLTQIFKNMLNAQNLNNPAKKFIIQGGVSEILGCFWMTRQRNIRANTSSTLPRSMRLVRLYKIISNSVSLCPRFPKKCV